MSTTKTPHPTTRRTDSKVATHAGDRNDGFSVVSSKLGLGRNLPQRLGDVLWAPMLITALLAFPVALILGFVRADAIADGRSVAAAQLQHATAGVMFIGFMAVFSAITFAVARILGVFREGGGQVQQDVTDGVQTLTMPATAKGMLALMMMGMMAIIVAVILHFYVAGSVVGSSDAALLTSDRWFAALEGSRRLGVGMYLAGIVLGLGTIIHVLRFQSVRLLELAADRHTTVEN